MCFLQRKRFLPPLFLDNIMLLLTLPVRNINKQTLDGGGVGEVLFFGEYLIKLQLPNKFYANSRQKQNCLSQGDFLLKHCFLKSVF